MDQKKQNMLLVAGLVLATVGAASGVASLVRGHSTNNEVAEIKEQIAAPSTNLQFANKAMFEVAVEEALASIVSKEQNRAAKEKYAKYAQAPETVPDGKWIYGDLSARFTLVEFSDLECGYCKRFHDTPKQLVDASKGNVNWQWMHLPLDFHNPAAFDMAVAAECVGEEKGNRGFWVMIDELFKNTRGNGKGVADLAAVAAAAGADVDLFRQCIASGRFKEKVQANWDQAKKLGVNGTPATFVVDNATGKSQLLSGAQPPQAFMAAMRKMIVEANEAQAEEPAEPLAATE